MTTRYVVTHLNRQGMRTLADPQQGRYTYQTPEQAQARLDAILTNDSKKTLDQTFGFPLEVRPVECWPVHFDPKGVYFD